MIFFCDLGGSSKHTREFLQTSKVREFMARHPGVECEFVLRRNHHPYVHSTFKNGYTKDVSLRSEEAVEQVLSRLANEGTLLISRASPPAAPHRAHAPWQVHPGPLEAQPLRLLPALPAREG
jgi:hypothetical protein